MANPVPGTIETKAPPDAPDRGAPLAAVHSRPRCDFHAFAEDSRARGSNRRDIISSTRAWRPSARGREDVSVEGMLHGVRTRPPRSRAARERGCAVHGHEPPNKRIQPTRVKRHA